MVNGETANVNLTVPIISCPLKNCFEPKFEPVYVGNKSAVEKQQNIFDFMK